MGVVRNPLALSSEDCTAILPGPYFRAFSHPVALTSHLPRSLLSDPALPAPQRALVTTLASPCPVPSHMQPWTNGRNQKPNLRSLHTWGLAHPPTLLDK